MSAPPAKKRRTADEIKMSHRMVERKRTRRINKLLDQLKEQVEVGSRSPVSTGERGPHAPVHPFSPSLSLSPLSHTHTYTHTHTRSRGVLARRTKAAFSPLRSRSSRICAKQWRTRKRCLRIEGASSHPPPSAAARGAAQGMLRAQRCPSTCATPSLSSSSAPWALQSVEARVWAGSRQPPRSTEPP